LLAQAARRVSHAMHRQRHDSSVHGRTHGGLYSAGADILPETGISMRGIFRYLPGEQRRQVLLTRQDICLGLGELDSQELLDSIPLHEIADVRKGTDDWKDLFTILDTDCDGVLSVPELLEGMAKYGLTPMETRALFFGQLEGDAPVDDEVQLSKYEFQRKADCDALRRLTASVLVIDTIQDGVCVCCLCLCLCALSEMRQIAFGILKPSLNATNIRLQLRLILPSRARRVAG